MTVTTNYTTQELTLQNRGNCCITAQRKILRIMVIYLITIALCFGITAIAYSVTRPTILDHPDFETNVTAGTPSIDKKYCFSTLSVQPDYQIQMCGIPAVKDNMLYLYVTNPKSNDVWFRVEVLDSEKNVIGTSGVLKTDEYLQYIKLDKALVKGDEITVKVIGYTPNTWYSAGNVNLQIKSFDFQ